MQETETQIVSMNNAYKKWRDSSQVSFLDKVPDSLLQYMFCAGWIEKEIIDAKANDIIEQINKLFK
jgi:hypothetical protein